MENPIGKRGMTIARTELDVRLNSTSATLSAEGIWGVIMVDGDSVAAGVLPDPILDPEAMWMHWQRRVYLLASDSQQNQHFSIWAMRKFGGNDWNALFILDNDDLMETIEFALGWRILIMHP